MTKTYEILHLAVPTPFTIGPVNCYLLTSDPPILVDTGPRTAQAYDALLSGMNRYGFTLTDIGSILITHGHLDHIGQLARMLKESGARAFAHPSVVRQWQVYDEDRAGTEAFYASLFRESGVPETIVQDIAAARDEYRAYGEPVLIDGATEEGNTIGPFQIRYVPGHSAGDVLFVDEDRCVLFTGDHLMKAATPFPLVRRPLPGHPRAKSLVELRESLGQTRALDGFTAYPGHGRPFADVPGVVDTALERHDRNARRLFDLLHGEAATPYQICRALFPKACARTLHFALSAAIGYLDVLEAQGAVVPEIRDGVQWYSRRTAPKS